MENLLLIVLANFGEKNEHRVVITKNCMFTFISRLFIAIDFKNLGKKIGFKHVNGDKFNLNLWRICEIKVFSGKEYDLLGLS